MISPNQDDFWGALKPVIFVSQLFSLFPVQGLFAKDASAIQFRWMSLRTLYALFFLTLAGLAICAQVNFIVGTKVSTGVVTEQLYFTFNFCGTVCFFVIACRWKQIMMYWRKQEDIFLRPPYKPYGISLRVKIGVTGLSLIALSFAEDILHILSSMKVNQDYIDFCNITEPFWMIFYTREHRKVFDYVPYNWPMTLLVEFTHKVYLFVWSFMDVFIALISIGLLTRFEQLYSRIEHLKGKPMSEAFWAEVRRDYMQISNLVAYMDRVLSPMILITCASDVYFITYQLYKSIQLKLTSGTTFYYRFSLVFLIFRVLVMLLTSSHVYVASRKPLEILRAVPMSSWTTSVQRFTNEILNIDSVLSGHKFFFLKRRIILAMAGTLITYELVMLSQVKATDSEIKCED